MIGTDVAEVTERREAARALLRFPVLCAAEHPEELVRVRRHAQALKSLFANTLGYPLVVESGFARLIKAPLTDDAAARPARWPSGGEFSARTYMYVALLGASLLAPEVGEQVLISTLIEQLRADAASAGLSLGDSYSEARQLVAAFGLLAAWGVVEETDGTIAGWGERREEALITVNRALLPHLLARPLSVLEGPQELLEDADRDHPPQPRRSLRRKLIENPLVRREDLTEAERDVLSRERTELTRVLEESFGLSLEVRAEGALAYDADAEVTDVAFPGSGTVRWAALLLVDALLAAQQPKAGTYFEDQGDSRPGLLCRWPLVDRSLRELTDQYGGAWGRDYVDDLDLLRGEVAALLTSLGLATSVEGGLALHPAAARYRPAVAQATERPRARRRREPAAAQASPASLFDPQTEQG